MALDERTLGLLFERHAKLIYNYCFRRVGDWGVAEDLVSVVFLEAWRRRKTLRDPEKALPWLYGIATNVVRNRRRAQRRYAAALGRVPAARPEPDFAGDALARLDDERVVKGVLADVAALPRSELDVFVLCAWFDVGYEDAAAALGIPVGTVRSRLSRARRRMRELEALSGHEESVKATREQAFER
jgi:RNA polymerase sigma-70 factor (ECF subfamily)